MFTMTQSNKDARNCTVSAKISEDLNDKLSGIFLRSGQTMNISEQINRALDFWTSNSNTNFDVIMRENQRISLEIEAKTIYEQANSLISGDNLMEICLKLAVIIRTHPKIFIDQPHLKDLSTLIFKSKVISNRYYDILLSEVLLLLTNPQKKILKQHINKQNIRYSGKPDIPITLVNEQDYTGGTLDSEFPQSDMLELANSCMTVPRRHRESKINDCIYLIQVKYHPEQVGDYEAAFLNAIARLESEEEKTIDD